MRGAGRLSLVFRRPPLYSDEETAAMGFTYTQDPTDAGSGRGNHRYSGTANHQPVDLSPNKNTTGEFNASSRDVGRSHGEPDAWTAAFLGLIGTPDRASKPGA